MLLFVVIMTPWQQLKNLQLPTFVPIAIVPASWQMPIFVDLILIVSCFVH